MRRVFQIAIVCAMLLYGLAVTAAPNPYAAGLKAYRAGQYATAYKTLLPLARKRDARAMYLVGVMYESGNGVPQDGPTAAGWFDAAAKLGNASAQYSLARMTIEGRGVEKSRNKGIALLSAAANQGHKEATALLERIGAAAAPAPQAATTDAKTASPVASTAVNPAVSPKVNPAAAVALTPPPASALPKSPGQSVPIDSPPPVVFVARNRAAAQASLDALRAVLARAAQTDSSEAPKGLPFLAKDFAHQYWHVESVGDVALARAFTQLARERPSVGTTNLSRHRPPLHGIRLRR